VAYVSYNDPIYGIYCIIDHGKGISTLYGHCSGLKVKVGQTVTKGQKIGYVGSSGIATGPHLHFGVLKNGVAIDPMKYFNIGA
jgi:murein DD-endopeptidase MepM/ murein hydrolase activator NlpD